MRCFVLVSVLALFLGVSAVVAEGFSFATKPQNQAFSKVSSVASSSSMLGLNRLALTPGVASRGGASATAQAPNLATSTSTSTSLRAVDSSDNNCPVSTPFAIFGSLWGSLGVVYILAKAITRVMPIALEPFRASSTLVFTPFHWGCYAMSCLFFAYAEGYKGFHLKFSPLVVKRSFSLVIGSKQGTFLNYLLAPLYSMGLVHATKKRMITSWCVTLGVTALVAVVKRLPGVWRCILDAGVVVGLSLGSASILYFFVKSIVTGQAPAVDACLPDNK